MVKVNHYFQAFKVNLMAFLNKRSTLIGSVLLLLSIAYVAGLFVQSGAIPAKHIYVLGLLIAAMHACFLKSFGNRALYGLVIGYGLLFIGSTSNFSPIDEGAHYDYIRHIVQEHGLPTLFDQIDSGQLARISGYAVPGGIQYEAVHPPLYYLIGAIVVSIFGFHPIVGFFALRLLGLVMLVGSLHLTLRTIRLLKSANLLTARSKWLTSGLLLVLMINPGMLTRMVTVSNESLVVVLSCALCWFLTRMHVGANVRYRDIAAAAVLSAAILLTKTTAIGVLVMFGAYLLYKRNMKHVLIYGAVIALCAMPWFIYNLVQYDTLTATKQHVEYVKTIVNPGNQDFGLLFALEQVPFMLVSYFIPQEYGYSNLFPYFYLTAQFTGCVMLLAWVKALINVFKWLTDSDVRRSSNRSYMAVVGIPLLIGPLLLLYGTASQDVNIMIGRYLYLALIPITVLILYGIQSFVVESYRQRVGALLLGCSSIMLSSALVTNLRAAATVLEKMKDVLS